jgi:hypothetical protein
MSEPTVVEYEMGYGADEFGNVLRGPFSSENSGYRCEENSRHHWALKQPGKEFDLTIEVAEKPLRKLGMFKLPVLGVKFIFINTEKSLQEKFFHRFHQYFHKGGG